MAGLFLKAVACSLREVPELNGFSIDGCSQTSTAVHLGVGVARRRGGPVIPVLLDADRRDLDDLMHALLAIVRRARAGQLHQSDVGHPTFTVTSLGELGVSDDISRDRSAAGGRRRIRQGGRAAVRRG